MNIFFRYNIFLNKPANLNFSNAPEIELGINAKESFFDEKLTLTQNVRYKGSRAFLFGFSPIQIENPYGSYIDLSLGLDFKVSKTISIFGQGTNLLASEYQLWYLHPVFERQFWGGVKINL